jgi:hypothetical protein
MTTHSALFNHAADLDVTTAADSNANSQGVLKRIAAWYMAKVHAERDAEIVAFIDERGGQFNDEMEREISRRFGGLAG